MNLDPNGQFPGGRPVVSARALTPAISSFLPQPAFFLQLLSKRDRLGSPVGGFAVETGGLQALCDHKLNSATLKTSSRNME